MPGDIDVVIGAAVVVIADDTAEDIEDVASAVDVSLPLEQAAALSTATAPTASVAAR